MTAFAGQCGLGRCRNGSDQIGIDHWDSKATPDVIGKKQRLIEFSFAEFPNMQGHWYDHINRIERRQSGEHEVGQWSRQGNFALVLKEADSMLEWGPIRVQRPSLRIGRGAFSAGLADMVWTVGHSNGGREGAITTGASSVGHEGNCAPAAGAKMRDRIICQKRAAIRTMNRKNEPDCAAYETRDPF